MMNLKFFQRLESIKQRNNDIIKINDFENNFPYYAQPKYFEEQTVETLYRNIINCIFIKKIFTEYETINNLGLEYINLEKPVIESIIQNLESMCGEYFIKDIEDLNYKEKIDFNFFLIKYLLKNRLNIFNNSFLTKTREIIIKYITSLNKYDVLEIPDNLEYIIKIFADSIDSKNDDYEKYKKSKLSQLLRSISSKNDLEKINNFICFHYLLFDKLSLNANIYSNEKNNLKIEYKLPDLDYNFNKIFEVLDKFKIDNNRFLALKVLEHIKNIKEIFENLKLEKSKKLNNEILYKEIKFEFKINENDIECKYSYYSQNEERTRTYKDEKIGDYIHEGLAYLLNDIKYDFENNDNNSLQNISNITRSKSIDSFNTNKISSYSSYNINNKQDLEIFKINKIFKNIKQLKDGNFLISEANKLCLYELNGKELKLIYEIKGDGPDDCVIDFLEKDNNKKSTEVLIVFKKETKIVNIYKNRNNNYRFNLKSSNKKYLTNFNLEINNKTFKLNITNICQNDLGMNEITRENNEKMIYNNRNIFRHTNLEDNTLKFNNLNNSNEEIEEYSVKSENGLCFMPRNENERYYKLLLASVNKDEKQYKLFLINFSLEGKKYSNYTNSVLIESESFEFRCICPILLIANNNNISYNPDNDKNIKITNLFFIGGFDVNNRKGKIELFKLIEENGNYNIKKLTDISFDKFEENKSSINCIIQSRVDGKFLIIDEAGNLYSYNLQIDDYLK